MKRLLFVCTGNSCRSPMAEAYFNHLAGRGQAARWRAASAGIYASAGAPASEQAQAVMDRLGVSMDDFRSARVTPELLDAMDLVVGMTASHLAALRRLDPGRPEKYHLLLEWQGDGDSDVPDPFGGSVSAYQRCFDSMKPALDRLFAALNHS